MGDTDIFARLEAADEKDRDAIAEAFLAEYEGNYKVFFEAHLGEFMASLEVYEFTAQ